MLTQRLQLKLLEPLRNIKGTLSGAYVTVSCCYLLVMTCYWHVLARMLTFELVVQSYIPLRQTDSRTCSDAYVEGDIGGKKKEEVMMVELATCKAHGFNERTWLKDVLCRLPEYEQGRKDYDDLLPELSLV